MMTQSELFATIVNHLWQQKIPAIINGCVYRGPNGTKCAIGCLITDEEYDPRMENRTIISLRNDFKVAALQNSSQNDITLLEHLQAVHDHSIALHLDGLNVKELRERFIQRTKQLAKDYDINFDFTTLV
jgi:hypothetical protein